MTDKLFKYVKEGDIDSLKHHLILSTEADVRARSKRHHNDTLLFAAVRHRQKICAIALIQIEPSLLTEAGNQGFTPLIFACDKNYAEMVEMLSAFPSCLEITDKLGRTALHHAAANKKGVQTTTALLANKANVNALNVCNRSPLSLAIENNNLETVQLLLNHGARIDVDDVLRVSIETQWPMLLLLLKHDPSIINNPRLPGEGSICHNDNSWQASLLAAVVVGKNSFHRVETLLNLGVTDMTPALFKAIKNGDEKLVKLLVESGANFMEVSDDGENTFEVAASVEAEKIFIFLLNQDWSEDCFIQNNPEQHPQSIVLRKHDLFNCLFHVIKSKWRRDDLLVNNLGPVSYMLSHEIMCVDPCHVFEELIYENYPVRGPGVSPLDVLCDINDCSSYSTYFEVLLGEDIYVPIDPRLQLVVPWEVENDVEQGETWNSAYFLALHYGVPYRPFEQCLGPYPDLVPLLLRFFAGPPVSLLLFIRGIQRAHYTIDWWNLKWYGLFDYYWQLVCYGLPLGTETVSRLKETITMFESWIESIDFHREDDFLEVKQIQTHFNKLLRHPPTLVTLTKFAYMKVLGKFAAVTCKSLPDVVKTEVPPGLKVLFVYDENPKMRCLGNKHCSCPDHICCV